MEQIKKFYPYTDENFKYIGVWQEKNGVLKSYWNRSVAEVGFTGSRIRVLGNSGGPVSVSVDGKEKRNVVLADGMDISVDEGSHVLVIVAAEKSCLAFEGVEIPVDQQLISAPEKPYLQFIGDSITHAKPGFSYTTGEKLGVDYSVRAYCGMSLTESWGWYPVKEGRVRPGMETMYYKLEDPVEADDYTDYRFEYCRKPDALVIFLGTNDYLDTPEDKAANHVAMFAETYDHFVTKLAQRYPDARIFILQALSDKHCRREGICAAYARMAAHLPRVELVPTETWSIEIGGDGTHPTFNGYAALGEKMTEYLKEKMGW